MLAAFGFQEGIGEGAETPGAPLCKPSADLYF